MFNKMAILQKAGCASIETHNQTPFYAQLFYLCSILFTKQFLPILT